MPQVVRGSRSGDSPAISPHSPNPPTQSPFASVENAMTNSANSVATPQGRPPTAEQVTRPSIDSRHRKSSTWRRTERDSSRRTEAEVYYDSRAATKTEFRRRATTLQDYYRENPKLLPQLPFTWHHGWRRIRLGLLIFLTFVDACFMPIILYYAMTFAGNVDGWITFAIVTTIWGGPTYLELAIRTLRLIKKERFYRPLGTNSRWCFDLTTHITVLAVGAVTTLFIVGSAPHIVWLRVLSMPGPALLYSLGGPVLILTIYSGRGWKAPFRLSSTAKGEPVRPGVYYIIEDIVAVNAGAGRPFREALSARYEASPRFQRIMYIQSIFWSIPAIVIAIGLTLVACLHAVPTYVGYGICWAVPFFWATLWGIITTFWVRHDLRREREEWEKDDGIAKPDVKLELNGDVAVASP